MIERPDYPPTPDEYEEFVEEFRDIPRKRREDWN